MDISTEEDIEGLADRIWARIVGVADPDEFTLLVKLAIEQRMLGRDKPSFGLDKLTTGETATYLGLQEPTLHDRQKRRALGVPEPYNIGRKLFWRRSELDAWVEGRRAPEDHQSCKADPYEPMPSKPSRGQSR
jgi:predicted DNA-binding transcriptional regulator AlpA